MKSTENRYERLAKEIEEKPYAFEFGRGKPTKPKEITKKPADIQAAEDWVKQKVAILRELRKSRDDLRTKVNTTLGAAAEEVAPLKKEIAEIDIKVKQEAQPLAEVLDNEEVAWRKVEDDLMIVISTIEEKKETITDKRKLDKIFEIVAKLGWDIDRLKTEYEKAIGGMTRYTKEEIKKIVVYPEKRPPTARATIKQAISLRDVWNKIKGFFVGIWNIIAPIVKIRQDVSDSVNELKKVLSGV
jgi:hypothetical protein